MREILSREKQGKKKARDRTFLSIALVGIMILSTAGYAFYQTGKKGTNKLIYNGIEFSLQDDGLWHFVIDSYEFSTVYNPKETENITGFLSSNLLNYQNNVLYIQYDSERQGIDEVIRNLGRFTKRVQYSCLDNCEENFPVKNCSDNVVIIKETKETLLRQEENCIYVLSKQGEVLRASDAFIFRLLGVQK